MYSLSLCILFVRWKILNKFTAFALYCFKNDVIELMHVIDMF